MKDCIFCKIASKEIPTTFLYEDEEIMVFSDIHPQAPVHLLIIPKNHIKEFVSVEDSSLFEKLGKVTSQMIKEKGLIENRYKIMINGGGLQDVDHLHIHLLGNL